MNTKFNQAKGIVQKLILNNYEAVIVGGAVRDYVMGKNPTDYDIATSAPPNVVEKIFNKTIGVGKQFGVILVIQGKNQFEVATFRKDSEYIDGRHPEKVEFSNAKEDVLRRDFTINGLFMHPENYFVIDFVGGQEDIKNKLIRCIGEPLKRFNEDHLRILRAIRFSSNLDFEIEKNTWNAMLTLKHLLNKISKERIREEFEKILKRPNALKGINLIFESGISSFLFCDNFFSDSENYNKILKIMLSHDENISIEQALSRFYISSQKFIVFSKNVENISICTEWNENLDQLVNYMKKFTFSNKTVNSVREIIKTLVTLFEKASLSLADFRKALGCEHGEIIYEIIQLINKYYGDKLFLNKKLGEIKEKYKNANILPSPFITGKELLDFNLKAGPEFSTLINKMYEIQLNNDNLTKNNVMKLLQDEIEN